MSTTSSDQLASQYQQKTDKQHILDNPDTYIGSIEKVDTEIYVYSESANKITLQNIEYNPGLYKLFDEAIVNARDHVVRMIQSINPEKKTVSYIDTTISEDGTITITNDGNGIDVAKHPEYGLWIPEMIFGHLRTSTNYNKEEKRTVGGKNGFGFKLVLIWSTYGYVETVDHTRSLKYIQEFKSNLDEICEPKITKCSGKPYTKVVFKPDYARLGLQGLSSDMLALFKKRVYDIGAVTDHSAKKIKVTLNTEVVPVKNFQQYIDLYIGAKDTADDSTKRIYESSGDRWEYAVALSQTHEFQQVSFVNGICTFKGGKHVDYIMGQITRKLVEYIEKKKKVKVNASAIKEQLILFLRCDIENPAFDSQTKDFMNTPSAKFGSTCSVTDSFIEKVAKMGVMDLACSLTQAKEAKAAKKTDGSKTKSIRGIANFIDANFSGTEKSKDCVLILCEGLSAMAGVVSGISSEDRNTIGIYPLKGKVLNVRGELPKKISDNKEIADIKKILGLEMGKEYKTIEDIHKSLRYGKVMVMTDQDLDGSHIKGLCINLFHSEWASLTKIPGFISFMNTPILRAKKGQETLLFYNEGEYQVWKDSFGLNGSVGWTIKYFKGLGTSTSAEFKEYFANKKIVDFVHSGPVSDDCIDKVFNKKRPDDRKRWLEAYDKSAFLNTGRSQVPYEEFIDQEMIHFSKYDCDRSIPCMVDGLKISLRKILYAAFKRKLTSEIKVAQFSGYVSEHSAYHHGEASLNGAIINMAQNYVGSNNINLLQPNGQFGTRLQGGSDSASERYIFTLLNPLTRSIFIESDDSVLDYVNDDGQIVEPDFYVPIIPFCLLNGISGIGTGFSCSIPSFDPKQIIQYLVNRLSVDREPASIDFTPYYEGFTGSVERLGEQKWLIRGRYEKVAEDKILITELPVGTWTMPYITVLDGMVDGQADKDGKKSAPLLKDFDDKSTEVRVHITVTFPKGKLAELEAVARDANGINGIEKLLKLTTTVSSTNMYMFNSECKLKKYESVQEIIDDFYSVRMVTYQKRKDAQIQDMRQRLVKLSMRAKYIQDCLSGKIDLRRKKADEVTSLLVGLEYKKIDESFTYLIKMPMDSVTDENVIKIMKEKTDLESDLEILISTSLEQIWLSELVDLEKKYDTYRLGRIQLQSGAVIIKKNVVTKKVVIGGSKK
jgi:DNA topoisomerase-2